MNAAASTVPAKQLGLLVRYRPLALLNTGERKTQPTTAEAVPLTTHAQALLVELLDLHKASSQRGESPAQAGVGCVRDDRLPVVYCAASRKSLPWKTGVAAMGSL